MFFLLTLYNILYLIFYLPLGLIGYIFAKVIKEDACYYQRMGFGMPKMSGSKPTFWFHAASVGEARSLRWVLASIRISHPQAGVVVSTMTVSGYTTAKDELAPDVTLLLPIENRAALKHAVKCYNTKAFFITDTELWPNLITAISEDIPLILLNGRISDKTYKRYKRFSFFFKPLLQRFRYIIAKSAEDAFKFQNVMGGESAVITGGNIKYHMDTPPALKTEMDFLTGNIALAASTHAPEEELFLKAVSKCGFDRVVVAPRHIKRGGEVQKTAQKLGIKSGLYSRGDIDEKVLIMDAIGMLETLYQKANKIFVGGSIPNIGGHNIFEALQYGKTVAVGVHTENFSDITALADKYGIITVVNNGDDLLKWLGTPENRMPADFENFFKELDKTQKDYLNTIERCIAKCIG